VLRFEGPIKILIRWVVQDHERDGRQVRAGDRVFLVLQSANRDKGEARAALPRILGRLGDIHVSGEVTWRPNIASRAVTGLRISYE
jgi:cytochrome P450